MPKQPNIHTHLLAHSKTQNTPLTIRRMTPKLLIRNPPARLRNPHAPKHHLILHSGRSRRLLRRQRVLDPALRPCARHGRQRRRPRRRRHHPLSHPRRGFHGLDPAQLHHGRDAVPAAEREAADVEPERLRALVVPVEALDHLRGLEAGRVGGPAGPAAGQDRLLGQLAEGVVPERVAEHPQQRRAELGPGRVRVRRHGQEVHELRRRALRVRPRRRLVQQPVDRRQLAVELRRDRVERAAELEHAQAVGRFHQLLLPLLHHEVVDLLLRHAMQEDDTRRV
ncbi:hypothetical protein PG997_014048 [Apiospora hydei]|uniref:Uncharacterized protein n=1 Tax=Apiospora hydei TaxID=1337664 RepID=A0ABR1V7X9_9PEZI